MRLKRKVAAALAAVATLLASTAGGAISHAAPGEVVQLTDPELAKPVGIAADEVRGVYWLANANAQPAAVRAVDLNGNSLGSVSYPAVPQSPQALAMYQGQLYVADIGDPQANRPNVQIHVLDGLTYGGSAGLVTWRLVYPDGPHDAKAFTVSPRGNLYLVTFGSPGGIYRAQAPSSAAAPIQLSYVAPAPDWVTDVVFVDPQRLAVRGYASIQILDAESDRYTPTAGMPLELAQAGESLTLNLAGTGVLADGWASGQGQSATLTQLAIPTTLLDLPAPPSSLPTPEPPPASASPAPSSSASATAPADDQDKADRKGASSTLIATGLALIFAVLMGALAYRKPADD